MTTPPKVPKYRRPELPFERKASLGPGAGQWSAAGFEFGLAVVLFFLGGRALDARLSTDPWLTVIGSMVGVAVGIYLLVRPLFRAPQKPADSKETGTEGDGENTEEAGR